MVSGIQNPIGVCSWSTRDFNELNQVMAEAKINHVHLDLNPGLEKGGERYLTEVAKQSWIISATMTGFSQENYSTLETIRLTGGIVPDDSWDQNRKRVLDAIDLTAKMHVKLLTFHFGFIDVIDPAALKKMSDRIRLLADAAAKKGITLLMETGQETAEHLRIFLEGLHHPAVGVNFDPANMILYGKGNPIEAVKILAPWIRHVHIKDARASSQPGTWGTEVPFGTGQVNAKQFLAALREIGYTGTLSIEREAGETRVRDILSAVRKIRES